MRMERFRVGGEEERRKGFSEMERMQQNRPTERSSAEAKFFLT